jgi:hypothetical protein
MIRLLCFLGHACGYTVSPAVLVLFRSRFGLRGFEAEAQLGITSHNAKSIGTITTAFQSAAQNSTRLPESGAQLLWGKETGSSLEHERGWRLRNVNHCTIAGAANPAGVSQTSSIDDGWELDSACLPLLRLLAAALALSSWNIVTHCTNVPASFTAR